ATNDLLAGHVHMGFLPMPVSLVHVQNQRLRAIGVTSRRRSTFMKDVPTVEEQGVIGYEVSPWYGVLAPAATPRPIINQLNAEISKILRSPDVRDKLSGYGAEPLGGSPESYAKTLRDDISKWRDVIAAVGLRENQK
ncbi:MAG: tripartite tricarboxylate transporter substrate-binding protein, partial [Betaproteobacteria bacterium]